MKTLPAQYPIPVAKWCDLYRSMQMPDCVMTEKAIANAIFTSFLSNHPEDQDLEIDEEDLMNLAFALKAWVDIRSSG